MGELESIRNLRVYIDSKYDVILKPNDPGFKEQSYQSHVAGEILYLILSEEESLPEHITGTPKRTPKEVVLDYYLHADCYEKACTNEETRYLCEVAKSVAKDLLEFL